MSMLFSFGGGHTCIMNHTKFNFLNLVGTICLVDCHQNINILCSIAKYLSRFQLLGEKYCMSGSFSLWKNIGCRIWVHWYRKDKHLGCHSRPSFHIAYCTITVMGKQINEIARYAASEDCACRWPFKALESCPFTLTQIKCNIHLCNIHFIGLGSLAPQPYKSN